MKNNSLFKGASLLLSMMFIASCATSSPVDSSSIDDTTIPTSSSPTIVESEYSCRKAREASDGSEVTVEGIVAKITVNDKQEPDGFLLADNVSSIYVYGSSIAPYVTIGNKVVVKGTKTHYILETEAALANKYGYIGSSQINATELVSDDEKIHDLDFPWVEPTTVKDILNTPFDQDITTLMYRVPAYIRRSQGQGFVNYYINDLDGETGTYVYTKCNGNDIDKASGLLNYDGKMVLLNLIAINAKSTATGCNWRFIPVNIVDPAYDFPFNTVPEFAIEYYVNDLIKDSYYTDPSTELPSSISNDIIPFENALMTYTSSNTSVVSIDNNVLHTHSVGEATLTISCEYSRNNKTYNHSVERKIEVKPLAVGETLTVKQAIEAEVDTEVRVRAVVGPSLVNQKGFYLIDDSGVIAVRTSEDIPNTYHIGDEVVIKGKRSKQADSQQIYIDNIQCEYNLYGNNEYSRKSFIKDKSATYFASLDVENDHSTEVYVFSAKVKKVATNFYTNYYITDDVESNTGISLYASSGNQYSWLDNYLEGEYTFEIAVCNWNYKKFVRGCILSVSDGTNTTYNTLNFN